MGGGAISGSIAISPQQEALVASRSVIQALQEQNLSIIRPEVGLDGVLPANTPWLTDTAPLPNDLIAEYNRQTPRNVLAPARYGIVYEGRHDVAGGEIRYRISARLYARGALGSWAPVPSDRYNGRFFVEYLRQAISRRLQTPAST